MEQVPEPKRRKIRDVVLDILGTADLETATEYSVRATAAQRLGTQLLNLQEKHFIRNLIDSFLLSTTPPLEDNNNSTAENGNKGFVPKQETNEYTSRTICELSDKRNVGILEIQGKAFVSIRDFYEKDGKLVPSTRGINLSAEQWSSFRSSFPAIEEAIATMESKIRSTTGENQAVAEAAVQGREQIQTDISQPADHQEGQVAGDRKENGDDVYNSEVIRNPEPQMPSERQQIEAGISNSAPFLASQGPIKQSLVPIKTIRLDGKNYYCWKHQTEFFLKQLDIAYVLSEPSNILEMAAQKWINDNYLCCHNILNSLSDKLFEKYSQKNYSAKELWEELKSTYDEDFRTTRSEVNKYMQFEIVEGVSILEQVQELHKIADSIMASGIWIDENFHVSAIISKLPLSWKDIRTRLMHEEVLSLNTLMHHLRVEEDSRSRYRNEKRKSQSVQARKKDVTKKLCYNCGKEGHISKSCKERNYRASEKSNGKGGETVTTARDAKINEKTD